MIEDRVYFSVQAWMVTKLNLKGCERDVYAIIYGYSQDGESDYHGSLAYLAELTGYSKNSICTALKNLTERNLIIKTEKETNNIKLCRYTTNFDSIQATCTPIQATCTNNKQDNKKELLSKDNNSTNFSFGKQKPKKESLYTNCVSMINDFVSKNNCDNMVRKKLIDYLNYRLSVKDKPLYANMWKGMLNKLLTLHTVQGVDYITVLDFCLERGYLSFYAPNNYSTNKVNESGVRNVPRMTSEDYEEEEKRLAELEAKGIQVRF